MATADPTNAKIVIPDAYLVAIGKVCVQWNITEAFLDMIVAKLAGMDVARDARSRIVVNHMSWPLKIDILVSLINELMDSYPRLQNYQATLTLLKKAQEGRNRIVHAAWGYEDGKVTIARSTARGKLKIYMDEIQVEDIDAVVADINKAFASLYNLVLAS